MDRDQRVDLRFSADEKRKLDELAALEKKTRTEIITGLVVRQHERVAARRGR